ncbi:alpha/beta-hydrolase [Basidiobolus meristosporus CBS 931.73]|uniref:Alpha/beta-hydrolase n=1 Tax=Basidiobolus meristosporus CBS 931.73 TaxID=1314790 RepID=A0A1Y1WDX3_9FUNG|nr:alpha/beta-hydrolase [Basidiobolus meristosporus CBS 931.73]|eukprot:ORX71721.1 alpha/beta-hydrolase [Basidiobolus meristosporus CBS 931.73]
MANSTAYSTTNGGEEHTLQLSDGRQLAYAHNGPADSQTLVIFFSGLMSVGTAYEVPQPCRELGVHWIAPTLAGNGNTSSRDSKVPYHETLAKDMCALLSHLYPTGAYEQIYVAGGSYGTVPAQMLYGAPYELFPPGRKIVGCVLLAGFSPFKYHKDHAKSLSWANWFSVGPPTQLIPFRLLQRAVSSVIGSKMKSEDGAKQFLRQTLFDLMDEDEKKAYREWLEKKQITDDEFIGRMARGAVTCCKNWDGFLEVSDVIHSDWGFEPACLDEEHASKPMLVVTSDKDTIGGATNSWLLANYKGAKAKNIPGGHISSLYYMDDIFQDIIKDGKKQ